MKLGDKKYNSKPAMGHLSQKFKRCMADREEVVERFRTVEIDAASEILACVMNKLEMKSSNPYSPPAHVNEIYSYKLTTSERARRKLWERFSNGRIDAGRKFGGYSMDDKSFDAICSDIAAIKAMYFSAINMCDAASIDPPPSLAGAKQLFPWIDKLRCDLGVDSMLDAYYDGNVPLEHVIAS